MLDQPSRRSKVARAFSQVQVAAAMRPAQRQMASSTCSSAAVSRSTSVASGAGGAGGGGAVATVIFVITGSGVSSIIGLGHRLTRHRQKMVMIHKVDWLQVDPTRSEARTSAPR